MDGVHSLSHINNARKYFIIINILYTIKYCKHAFKLWSRYFTLVWINKNNKKNKIDPYHYNNNYVIISKLIWKSIKKIKKNNCTIIFNLINWFLKSIKQIINIKFK